MTVVWRKWCMLAVVPLALQLSGCSNNSSSFDSKWGVSSSPRVVHRGPVPKGGGRYKLGLPYKIGGRWYVPREDHAYDRRGVASWYGTEFHGRKTANGELYDMSALTAAHPTLPMPSYAYVTNVANGRTVMVRINDRGPYVNDRVIDLSNTAARLLDFENRGKAMVRVRYAGRAPLNGDDRQERQFLASQSWSRSRYSAGPQSRAPAIQSYADLPDASRQTGWSHTQYRTQLAGR